MHVDAVSEGLTIRQTRPFVPTASGSVTPIWAQTCPLLLHDMPANLPPFDVTLQSFGAPFLLRFARPDTAAQPQPRGARGETVLDVAR